MRSGVQQAYQRGVELAHQREVEREETHREIIADKSDKSGADQRKNSIF